MNKKQSLKAASKTIEDLEARVADLERINRIHEADTVQFYECIEGTVDGKSICGWCNDHEECQLKAKDGIGCKEWQHIVQLQKTAEAQDEG